jgi:hypothetical protein
MADDIALMVLQLKNQMGPKNGMLMVNAIDKVVQLLYYQMGLKNGGLMVNSIQRTA